MMPELRQRRTWRLITISCAVQLFVAASAHAQTQTQISEWQLEQGVARFTAGYTFGSFSGSTTSVRGSVRGESLQGATGNVEVLLDSLSTGNDVRDKHMRTALETSAHPRARFTTDSIRAVRPAVSDSALLFGTFTVKGVSRPVRTRARVREVPQSGAASEMWLVDTAFEVALADYGITEGISRFFGAVKVAPVVNVSLSARFIPAQAAQARGGRSRDDR